MSTPATGPSVQTMTTKEDKKEIKFATIKPFDGKRENFQAFQANIGLYLLLNDETFKTDEKRILWILGFLQEGTASTWRNDYIRTHTKAGKLELAGETLEKFSKELNDSFYTSTEETDATNELKVLTQGNTPAEEFFTEFELLCGRAAIHNDKHKIDLLKGSIHQRLLQKILYSENLPNTYAEWREKAIRFDQNWRRAQAILGKPIPKDKGKDDKSQAPRYGNKYNPGRNNTRDPNAMEIDTMTSDERYSLLRKGACFNCKQTGHMAKDCPKKQTNPPRSNKPWWNDQNPRTGNKNYAESSGGSSHTSQKFNRETARKFIREIEWENEDEKTAFILNYDPEDYNGQQEDF